MYLPLLFAIYLPAIYAIVMNGKKLFLSKTPDATEFRIKGVAYMPRPNTGDMNINSYDFFTDDHEMIWKRDLKQFYDLHINTLRIYAVDPSKSHDKFMCALAALNISIILDTSAVCENCAIPQKSPPTCYNAKILERNIQVYNAFASYENVIAFSIGNENNYDEGISAPCVKALLRDMREYAKSCATTLRQVPIGLVHADKLPRSKWIGYYDCLIDGNENTRAEWQGWNQYVECDPLTHLTYASSTGMKTMASDFKAMAYSRPVIFTEFGCNTVKNTVQGIEQQRAWKDAKWMNEETDLTTLFAGGIAFEYSVEAANAKSKYPYSTTDTGRYGIGYFTPSDCDDTTKPCKYVRFPEFSNLSMSYNMTKPSILKQSDYKPPLSTPLACPSEFDQPLPAKPITTQVQCGAARKPVCKAESVEALTAYGSVTNASDDKSSNVRHSSASMNSRSNVVVLSVIIVLVMLV